MAAHLRSAASYSAALATLNAAEADAEACGRADLLLRVRGLRGNVLSRLGQARDGIAAAARRRWTRRWPGRSGHRRRAAAAAGRRARALRRLPGGGGRVRRRLPVLRRTRRRCRRAAVPGLRQRWCCSPAASGTARPASARTCSARRRRRTRGRPAPGCSAWCTLCAERPGGPPAPAEATSPPPGSSSPPWMPSSGACASSTTRQARSVTPPIGHGDNAQFARPRRGTTACRSAVDGTFFTEQGLTADTGACAAALMRIAEATAQPEAIAALAHARGETLLAGEPEAAAHELSRGGRDVQPPGPAVQRRASAARGGRGHPARRAGPRAGSRCTRLRRRRPARRPSAARKLHRGAPPARRHATPSPAHRTRA